MATCLSAGDFNRQLSPRWETLKGLSMAEFNLFSDLLQNRLMDIHLFRKNA
jgi:hypothetical protein